MSTNAMQLVETSAAPGQRRLPKVLWRLFQIVLLLAPFLILDWFYTAAVQRRLSSQGKAKDCQVGDPIRHHAFEPICVTIAHWGRDSYEFSINGLGFRDQTTRQVPLTDARPRLVMLGDSMTEGKIAWRDSYVGRIAARFPQYDVLNGGVASYAPSNYLNTARMLLAKGVDFDEAIVFIDISDVQDEAAFYHDKDSSGAVTEPAQGRRSSFKAAWWHYRLVNSFRLTSNIAEFFERRLVALGWYHLIWEQYGNVFDSERAAWTYRQVNETDPYSAGYAPLGMEGGIAKEKSKMDALWQELEKRNIPLSAVVYPHPPQLVHDTVDSRQVRIWRDWCQGKCKRFINLFPAFFAVKENCFWLQPGCWYPSHFIFGDNHYNAAGNALVADVVIQSLTEEPPVKLSPKSGHDGDAR